MSFKNFVWLLIVLMLTSCAQRTSKGSRSLIDCGLQIENGPTRGLGITDTLGTSYGLVYITTTITNVSTVLVQIQMSFPMERDYPIAYGKEQFKIILLPKEWGQDGLAITDSMVNELPKHIDKPFDDITLEPGEKGVETIGILRPNRKDFCSATPYALLEYCERGNHSPCEWANHEDGSSKSQYALGLKVGFCTIGGNYDSCSIIPLGQISYSGHDQ